MEFQELKHKIQKNDLSSVYLFTGPEMGDKNVILDMIKKALFSEDDPVIHTFYCDNDFSPADFIDTIQTGALFSSNKLIILKGIEQASAKVTAALTSLLIPESIDSELFEKYFSSDKKITSFYELKEDRYFRKKIKESDKTAIREVFAQRKFPDLPDGVCMVLLNETNDPIPESVTRLFASAQTVVFYEMFLNKKNEWIRSEFKKHNLNVEDRAVLFLLDTIENNKNSLEREIFNISVSLTEQVNAGILKPVVTRDFIEEHLYHSKEESPFSLFSAMISGELDRAISILNKLISEDREGILPGLIWSQRRLVRIIDLYENMKMQPFDIFKEMFIRRKNQQDELMKVLGKITFEQAVHGLRMMTEAEYYVRIFPLDLKIVKLQQLIIDCVNGSICKSFLQGRLQYLQC